MVDNQNAKAVMILEIFGKKKALRKKGFFYFHCVAGDEENL
jgi:hypothetical protein